MPVPARSAARTERLIDAARDLANDTGTAAFTVVQVAERAGLSLKSFYRCFPGKDDLLVALLAEDSRVGAVIIEEQLAACEEPGARLRAYVEGIFELLTHPGALGYAGVLVREHRRLSEDRPGDLRGALAPLVDLLAAEVAGAAAAGAVRAGDAGRDAETIFGLVLAGIHDVTLGRAEPLELAAYLWRFCWAGLRAPGERSDGEWP